MRRVRPEKGLLNKPKSSRGKLSKSKGNGFELLIGKKLSLWISRNLRSDLFARNVLSGGKFTRHKKQGSDEGIAGDLMSAHPSSVEFAKVFNVECKHYGDIGLLPFFFDQKGTSWLAGVIKKCEEETEASGKSWMLMVRQNMKPIIVGLQSDLARAIIWRSAPQLCHTFRTARYSVTFFLLDDFLAKVGPKRLTKIGAYFPMKQDPDDERRHLWERQISITGV